MKHRKNSSVFINHLQGQIFFILPKEQKFKKVIAKTLEWNGNDRQKSFTSFPDLVNWTHCNFYIRGCSRFGACRRLYTSTLLQFPLRPSSLSSPLLRGLVNIASVAFSGLTDPTDPPSLTLKTWARPTAVRLLLRHWRCFCLIIQSSSSSGFAKSPCVITDKLKN